MNIVKCAHGKTVWERCEQCEADGIGFKSPNPADELQRLRIENESTRESLRIHHEELESLRDELVALKESKRPFQNGGEVIAGQVKEIDRLHGLLAAMTQERKGCVEHAEKVQLYVWELEKERDELRAALRECRTKIVNDIRPECWAGTASLIDRIDVINKEGGL